MELMRVTSSDTVLFVVVSEALFGQWVHWYGNRSSECRRDTGNCDGCQAGWPSKWKGYLHVCDQTGKNEGFLELTPTAIRLIEAQLPPDRDWRGVRFQIRKTKGGPKGRYVVSVLEHAVDAKLLPLARDPLPLLRKLWNARQRP